MFVSVNILLSFISIDVAISNIMFYFCITMNFESNIPQIAVLRKRVEERFGKPLTIHNDFVMLVSDIELVLREHISESTLERVWNYSTRGNGTVSLRTLDVLAQYCANCLWFEFCKGLDDEQGIESEVFNVESIESCSLSSGMRLRIGWLPNRLCVVRYLGDNCYVAEECINSTMQEGDTFSCLQFSLGKEAVLSDFRQKGSDAPGKQYGIGLKNGLTTLKIISS